MLLRHKFYGFTGAVYVVVIGTAVFQYGYGEYRARKLREAGDFAVTHMRADMAHDAIRSDVYAFLRGEETGKPDEAKDAARDLLAHAAALTEVMKAEAAANGTEGALHEAVLRTGAEAERYVRASGAVVAAAPDGRSAALGRFNVLFRAMETAMEEVGDHAAQSAREADDAIRRGAVIFYAAAAAAMTALAAAPLLADRVLFRPFGALSVTMRRYAESDYDAPCYGVGRDDEIGEMAAAVLTFKKNGTERIRLQKAATELAAKAEDDRKRQLKEIADALELEIKGAVTSLSDSARALSGASAEMSATVTIGCGLTSRAEQAASGAACNVSAVSAAADQLNASVHEISGQVKRADELARRSQESAEDARRAVSGLSEATAKVEGVMESIGRVAAQINLLALNAGVESVRAGESGKGFAVVAGEVKNLAAQTDRSVREIKTVTAQMMTSAVDIRAAVEAILESAGSISTAATGVSVAVEQQNAVTEDVAKNMRAAAFSVRSVSEGLIEAGTVSQRADKAASVIAESAGALSAKAGELEGRTTLFLKKLLAA